MVRLLNVCFITSMVPVDWVSARVVPLYKSKGDRERCECTSFSKYKCVECSK